MTRIVVNAPPAFRFLPTVTSHGWCVLYPFGYDEAREELTRIQSLADGIVARLHIRAGAAPETVEVDIATTGRPPTEAHIAEIRRVVARMLNFDQELEEFYDLV